MRRAAVSVLISLAAACKRPQWRRHPPAHLGAPLPQRPLELYRGDGVHRVRRPDLLARDLAEAQVLHLARLHQLLRQHRAGGHKRRWWSTLDTDLALTLHMHAIAAVHVAWEAGVSMPSRQIWECLATRAAAVQLLTHRHGSDSVLDGDLFVHPVLVVQVDGLDAKIQERLVASLPAARGLMAG